jgi:hypothetical protein
MKIVEKQVDVYGILYTMNRVWNLIEPEPEKHTLPFYMREDTFRFHVIDSRGFDNYLDVKGDFSVELFMVLEKSPAKYLEDESLEPQAE